MTLILRDATPASGEDDAEVHRAVNPYATDQTNTLNTGITRNSFTANGQTFFFSPS